MVRKRGIGLLTVLGIASVLSIIVAAVAAQAVQHLRVIGNQDWRGRAYFAAYAGLQYACSQLEDQPYRDALDDPNQSFPSDPEARFSVNITNNLDGNPNTQNGSVVSQDGTTVPAGKIYIRSDGNYAHRQDDGCVTIRALLDLSRPEFNEALFGDQSVEVLAGGFLDSYTSSLSGRNAYTIGTNADSLDNGSPIVVDAGFVNGTIKVGAQATNANALVNIVSNNSPTSPTIGKLSSPKKLPAFAVPNNAPPAPAADTVLSNSQTLSTANVSSYHNLHVSGNVTFQAGTYYVEDTLNVTTANISVQPNALGNTIYLYVGNRATFNGATLNAGNQARQFQMFMIGTGASDQHASTVTLTSASNATMVCAGWGLNATVDGNSQWSGAVMGSHIKLSGNSGMHYDESLKNAVLGQKQDTGVYGFIFNANLGSNSGFHTLSFPPKMGDFQQQQMVEAPVSY